ncbi:MAG: hypothetical protein HW412_410 [Bacteroidetes bacterium]|nr:hypothetical protein [Bacteroidota bacterium]
MKRLTKIVLWLPLVWGCEKAFDLATLPQQGTPTQDTTYVQLSPPFEGFTNPQDVMVGNDQLLYVAEEGKVVMMNLAGIRLSSRSMLQPLSLAQDSRLDLLVGGSIVGASGDTLGALFRIHLVSSNQDSAHRLDRARIDTVWTEIAHPLRRFPGITVLPDNSWLAVRTSSDSAGNRSPVDPDARVLLFDSHDAFITPLPAFITGGQSPISINRPTAIASFPGVKDFVVAQSGVDVNYGALWMLYQRTPDFDGWLTRYDPTNPTDFFKVGRYVQPEAIAIDKARRDVFVADAALDSVFKFNSRGVFKVESFGLAKSNGFMRKPTGLAFFNRVLFVADAQQGQILRFILSADVPR